MVNDFVSQFYNLEGDLISERKKNFFKLLKAQPVPLNEDDLKNLCPRTYLESLFQIDIFIYFKLSAKLLDVIKGGNEVFISKILKHPALLMDIIGNISAESFVNDFLPCTSYTVRMKILKRISMILEESQMDEIVSAVHRRYGLHIASKILHTCSSKKIQEYFCKCEVKLKPRQLIFIFDKNPELLLSYFKFYKTSTGKQFQHKKVCRYIAIKNPKMLLMLQKEQTIRCKKLGRRVSKTLIDHSGDDFVNNIEFYSNFLKLDAMARKLHGNFKETYFKLFPRDIEQIRMNNFCNTLLLWYPKKNQWDLFSHTFMRVFGEDILDNLIYLSMEFVPLIPNKTILNKLGEELYSKNKTSYYGLTLCFPNKVTPLIKEKLDVSSFRYERRTFISVLLENCKIYDDMTSLEAILQYFCVCHLEEEYIDIVETIYKLFTLEKFNENHWKHIIKIISVLKSRNQLNFMVIGTLVLKHIEFLVVHQKPFREELILYIEEIELNMIFLLTQLKNPRVEKQVLFEIIDIYPDKVEYIKDIINFNERYPEDTINMSNFPIYVEYISTTLNRNSALENTEGDILARVIDYNYNFPKEPIAVINETKILEIFRQNKENFHFDTAVKNFVNKANRSKFENEILQFFWTDLLERNLLRRQIIPWLFKNEPNTLSPHFYRLWSIDQYSIEAKDIKLMSHLDFDKQAIGYFIEELKCIDDSLNEINDNKSSDGTSRMEVDNEPKVKIDAYRIRHTIQSLSNLLTTSRFIEIAKRFVPLKDKIDPADTKLQDIYYLQCELAEMFKKVDEPVTVLPTLMKFCLGDYLQSALPSLYSVCYRTPETLLYSYMDILSKRAVSARKHSIFLSCEVLSYNYTLSRLQNFKEKNVSSRKHMLSAALNYFRKSGNEELLHIIAHNLTNINVHDVETFYNLIHLDVPKLLKGLFIQRCWYAFENLRTKEVDVEYYLESFLSSMLDSEDCLQLLSFDFYQYIIFHYFKDSPESGYDLKNYIYRFVCSILRNLKSEQTNNFKFVFDIINSFKSNNSIKTVKTFFNTFYDTALQDIKTNNKIDSANNYHIELFKQYWFNSFTIIEMFDEHVLLNLLYLRCKSSDNLIENYARGVGIYLEQLVDEYGPFIYSKFKDLVLHKHSFTEKEKCLFFYDLLKFKNSTLNCLLVQDLLKCQYSSEDTKEIRCQIIDILKKCNKPIVSMNFD